MIMEFTDSFHDNTHVLYKYIKQVLGIREFDVNNTMVNIYILKYQKFINN